VYFMTHLFALADDDGNVTGALARNRRTRVGRSHDRA